MKHDARLGVYPHKYTCTVIEEVRVRKQFDARVSYAYSIDFVRHNFALPTPCERTQAVGLLVAYSRYNHYN